MKGQPFDVLPQKRLKGLGSKVESRDGDEMRFGTRSNDWEKRGMAAPWVAVNAGKRSITMDLKSPKAIEAVKRLVTKVDVVMENFRPGTMARLGLDPEQLVKEHPRLIVCSISGFGDSGPYASRKAYDLLIQAESGLASVTGSPESADAVTVNGASR